MFVFCFLVLLLLFCFVFRAFARIILNVANVCMVDIELLKCSASKTNRLLQLSSNQDISFSSCLDLSQVLEADGMHIEHIGLCNYNCDSL